MSSRSKIDSIYRSFLTSMAPLVLALQGAWSSVRVRENGGGERERAHVVVSSSYRRHRDAVGKRLDRLCSVVHLSSVPPG